MGAGRAAGSQPSKTEKTAAEYAEKRYLKTSKADITVLESKKHQENPHQNTVHPGKSSRIAEKQIRTAKCSSREEAEHGKYRRGESCC